MANEMIGNRYIIVKKVGEGGMATVYLAIDTILKREVAIKVLRNDLSTDEVNLKRFQREAMAITSTSHPNIVEVFDVGQDGDQNYIVMEYVYGKTLKKLIRQRGVIPVDEAVNIMKQLVSAVAHAHHQGIIHRDIKSQNVLVKDDGTVKLSDFGIAQMGDAAQQLTQAETVVGSVHYLAPEVASGKPASFQSDIYSLGIVFYEILTGDVPFHGETAVEIALKHLHDEIPSVRQFNPRIPQSVENIVIRATAKKPELRYESADKMYNDLITCLDLTRNRENRVDLESQAREISKEEKPAPVVHKETREERLRDEKQRKTIVYSLIAIFAMLLILLFGNAIRNNNNSRKIQIPDISLYTLEEARTLLNNLELDIEKINYVISDEVERGKIISISPDIGTQVFKGSQVVLTVSLGQNFVLEDYVGQHIDNVKPLLEKEGFKVNVYFIDDEERHPYGTIVSQDRAAGTVYDPNNSNRVISFEIADYPTFTIPATIKGMDIDEAKKLLEDLGAKVKLSQLSVDENIDADGNYIYPPKTVVRTDPAINTIYRQTDDVYLTIYFY